jgi:hypothetical protein
MKYRKKPVVVEAIQYDGSDESWQEIMRFVPEGWKLRRNVPLNKPTNTEQKVHDMLNDNTAYLQIDTSEGRMRGAVGCWVIKGVAGEFYFCKPDIFDATYEVVS